MRESMEDLAAGKESAYVDTIRKVEALGEAVYLSLPGASPNEKQVGGRNGAEELRKSLHEEFQVLLLGDAAGEGDKRRLFRNPPSLADGGGEGFLQQGEVRPCWNDLDGGRHPIGAQHSEGCGTWGDDEIRAVCKAAARLSSQPAHQRLGKGDIMRIVFQQGMVCKYQRNPPQAGCLLGSTSHAKEGVGVNHLRSKLPQQPPEAPRKKRNSQGIAGVRGKGNGRETVNTRFIVFMAGIFRSEKTDFVA
jgi:hypothetical protein